MDTLPAIGNGSNMAKRGNSVIGIDSGKHVFKGVLLHREGDSRYVLTSYASREIPEEMASADHRANQLKLRLKDLVGSAKGCAIAISDPGSLLRIIEQPETPVDLLRTALATRPTRSRSNRSKTRRDDATRSGDCGPPVPQVALVRASCSRNVWLTAARIHFRAGPPAWNRRVSATTRARSQRRSK